MEFFDIKVKVRLAEPDDLKVSDYHLKIGQSFWLKSGITGEIENKPYIITSQSDRHEIASWLKQKRIFVAASFFEIKDFS